MLPKKEKIKRSEFPLSRKNTRQYSSSNITLRVSDQKQAEKPSKFSVVVSGKAVKKAVLRNLLKRRIYNIIKGLKKDIIPGFVCVLYIKKGAETVKGEDLKKEIMLLFKKSKILK